MDGRAAESIRDRHLHRRAVEAVIWGMPGANFELMRSSMSPSSRNTFLYWSKLLDWHNQTLTPNPDLVYYMAFMDVGRDGPLVVEIPPSEPEPLNGTLCTVWQMPLEDVGKFGADRGEGGKYLILPPDHDEEVPAGYRVVTCDTQQAYMLIRSVLSEGTQQALERGLEVCSRIRIYPLSAADNPPDNDRIDLTGTLVDTLIPYDLRFFEALDRVVQAEPWISRDRPFSEILETIGIKRGEVFDPSPHDIRVLEDAAREAHTFLRHTYENDCAPWADGSRWFFPVTPDMIQAQATGYADEEVYPYTSRGTVYHMAFIGLKHLGAGQFYLVNVRDSDGELFDSAARYTLHLPAGVPVSQYWSVVMYDRETHGFIRGNEKYSVSSHTPGLVTNADGSVDVHFAPAIGEGHDANTILTGNSTGFELMFRFYGVEASVMSKEWVLPDVDRVQ